MAATKSTRTSKSTKSSKARSTSSSASGTARKVATGAAKSAARSAAKGAAKSAAKGATKASGKAVAAGGDRLGRGTRWTDQQVRLLLETVATSQTAKDAFEKVAGELNKSAGTVAQKYYNLQKATGAASKSGRGRPKGSASASKSTASASAGRASSATPSAAQLRDVTVDELTSLATRVRAEIDRRREELEAASKRLAG